MKLSEQDIQAQLSRRRPGQNKFTTSRNEADQVEILSGTESGFTLGTPVALLVKNKDHRPGDYKEMADIPRPSHADFTYQMKYGIRSSSGGGRSSARETIGRVAAGAIAEKWLYEAYGVSIVSYVSAVGDISIPEDFDTSTLSREQVDSSAIRCPDLKSHDAMMQVINTVREDQDSIGGVVTCICRNIPAGWGEPCFDKLEAKLAHAMLSIPATKGFEIGSGFKGTTMKGSDHNDCFVKDQSGKLKTLTNFSGGIQGGISNGQDILIRVAFKPPATIGKEQITSSFDGSRECLAAKGRHDPCVVPRAVPIVEAMCALVLADAAMLQESRSQASSHLKNIGRVPTSFNSSI